LGKARWQGVDGPAGDRGRTRRRPAANRPDRAAQAVAGDHPRLGRTVNGLRVKARLRQDAACGAEGFFFSLSASSDLRNAHHCD
jgi:hypothetical protein